MLVLLGSVSLAPLVCAEGAFGETLSAEIDWRRFLSRHDLVWNRLPEQWDEAPFLGNGMLGAMLYRDPEAGALRLDIGRCDVEDHRSPVRMTGFDRARLPIGHFLLRTMGRIAGAQSLRLVLHDAILMGTIRTDRGTIGIRAYVHADDMVIVVELSPSVGERGARWEWIGEEAISPRQAWGERKNDPARMEANYRRNPPGVRDSDGDEQLWLQPLLAGGGTATAWRSSLKRLIVSVAHRFPGDGACAIALAAVRSAAGDLRLEARHVAWWHKYYPESFVSLPDTRLESFYWIQMYKLAAATRGDRAFIDDQGPWLQPTAWPYATWNLNVQLSYWPTITSNRTHLAGSLIRVLHDGQAQLIANVEPPYRADSASLGRATGTVLETPVKAPRLDATASEIDGGPSGKGEAPPEMGNLPWALHDVWLVWRHTMDESLLRDTLFPLLRRTTNYYRHFLKRSEDGKIHLPPTYSPEYGAAPDLNYDLALLRWSCGALIEAAARLRIDDPLIPEWRRILVELVDYPQDADGLLIGAGLPLRTSHRHFSHMLMIYPLYLMNRDQPHYIALIERSLAHWQSMPAALQGYSFTAASSISSALGKGDDALSYLRKLIDGYLRPNTLYREDGPVIETPLAGAQSIHDMLLQSWGGVVRPFPAMPSRWGDAVFARLSAEGGFLVSARRSRGATRWIEVTSRAGEPLAIVTDIADPVATVAGTPRVLRRDAHGRLTARLAKGETILLHLRGDRPDTTVAPLPAGVTSSFGLPGE